MFNGLAKKMPDNDYTRRNMPLIKKAAEEYLNIPIKTLPYSKFKLYFETGSRVEYEADYIDHRRRINVFAAMCLYEENKKWINALEDALWAVCDEFTWSLPAHLAGVEFKNYAFSLDLFSCETGFMMSEIWYLLGDRLSDRVKKRIESEVGKRIIDVYLKNKNRWNKNNWSAVCAGSIGCTMMYMSKKEEFESVIDNLTLSMQDFLESFYDDGACLEGSLYWEYGFGFFCFFAQMLYEYTDGKYNYFNDEKIHKIALFRQYACLEGNMVIPFADAPHYCNYGPGLVHFLAKKYDDVTVAPKEFESVFGDDTRHRFASFIRNFFWYDESIKKTDKPCDCYLPDAQWYIKTVGDILFAAKGGNNAEPHNHNDVGSFIIAKDGRFIIDDLGWPEYYNGYFGPDRIKNICVSSRGHNLPLINSMEQQAGEACCGEVKSSTDSDFIVEFSKAYSSEKIKSVTRSFSFGGKNISLKDSFSGDISEVRERFVTRIKPEIKEGFAEIAGIKIKPSADAEIKVSTVEYEPRAISNINMKSRETAYLIDFCFGKISEIQFEIC